MPAPHLARFEALVGVALEDVAERDLQRLIDGRVREEEDLDFKADLYKTNDKDRVELAKDVAALANRRGGVLVLGVADENGEAVGLSPVAMSEKEELRMRQVLADRVAPTPNVSIRRVPTDSSKELGYYLLDVPASADRPHAVRREIDLRYPARYGAQTRYLSESEVADAYRDRLTRAQGSLERLTTVEAEGSVNLNIEAEPWLSLAVVPASTLTSEITFGLVSRWGEWLEEVWRETIPSHTRDAGLPRLTVGYRRLIGASWLTEDGSKDTYLELHTDGSGFAAVPLRDMVGSAADRGMYIVEDQGVALEMVAQLYVLARHAVDHGAASGDAVAIARVHSNSYPARLGRLENDAFPAAIGTTPLRLGVNGPHSIVPRALAASGSELLLAARLFIGDLWSGAGVPEAGQVDSRGGLRINFFSQTRRPQLQQWAGATGVTINSELEISLD